MHSLRVTVASCLALGLPQVKEVVRFSDNDLSVIFYSTAVAGRVGGVNVVILTGEVQDGPHTGRVAVKTVQLIPGQPTTQCLTQDGLDVSTGFAELQILG
ncbi:hypothetical protein [Streptomyces sp. NPDC002644]